MKKLFLCSLLAALCGLAHAGIDDADDAFRKGRFQEAYDQYVKLAEHGSARAHVGLAMMYVNGQVVNRDLLQAIEHANKAADGGEYAGLTVVGHACMSRHEPARAIEWYSRAADQRDPNAMRALARLYIDGKFVPQDAVKGLALLEKAADSDDLLAVMDLGRLYETGEVVAKDPDKARKLYEDVLQRRKVAHKELSYRVARLYEAKNTTEAFVKATRHYKDAVRGGNVDAMLALGRFAEQGKGASPDGKDALSWYRKAAEAGNVEAKFRAGTILERGMDVERNDTEAFKLYAEAADLHYLPALIRSARMRDAGRGTGVDHAAARHDYCAVPLTAQRALAERLNASPDGQMAPWVLWLGLTEQCATLGSQEGRYTMEFRKQVGEVVGATGIAQAHALTEELRKEGNWSLVLAKFARDAKGQAQDAAE